METPEDDLTLSQESDRRFEWSARAWWSALAALVAIAVGELLALPSWSLFLISGVALFAGRPRLRTIWPWIAVAAALIALLAARAGGDRKLSMSEGLDLFCTDMLTTAQRVTADSDLRRLFTVSGEALEPDLPFRILGRGTGDQPGRTLYLSDDFGELVAWAGEQGAFPAGVRPLGQREWGLVWFAGRAVVWVREPVLIDGRIVGAVTVAQSARRNSKKAWGMEAPGGGQVVLYPAATRFGLPVEPRPGVSLRVALEEPDVSPRSALIVLGLLVLSGLSIRGRAGMAWVPAFAALAVWYAAANEFRSLGTALVIVVAAAALGRLAAVAGRYAGLAIGVGGLGVLLVGSLMTLEQGSASWLPNQLMRPGWPVVWILAAAFLMSGVLIARSGSETSLARKIALAAALACFGLVLEIAQVPAALIRAQNVETAAWPVSIHGSVENLFESGDSPLFLDDSAHLLADSWDLASRREPSAVTVVDELGAIVSLWGDLSLAGEAMSQVGEYELPHQPGIIAELWVAAKPWACLGDWKSGQASGGDRGASIWFAAMSRSGSVAATLHPQIRGLDPGEAGTLFHRGGGWIWMRVGDARLPGRVWRDGDWLVVAIARHAEISVWAVRAAIACIWALVGLVISSPPRWRVGQLGTFGGKLRLLIAGGVVVPLMTLTAFLQTQIARDAVRREQLLAHDAISRAQSTIDHLQEGLEVGDELAGWLARQIGAELAIFEGSRLAGSSRPDLVVTGELPELPMANAYPLFVLGRDEVVIGRQLDRLVAAKTIEFSSRRVMLQVFPGEPHRLGRTPQPVDWLLTGALLAALIALSLTSRIESRLSASLLDVVDLARRVQRGEPLSGVRRPVESDLADVVRAVELMSQEVQRREEGLKHQQDLLRITLGTLESSVLVRDAEGGVLFANPSAQRLLEQADDRAIAVLNEVASKTGEQDGPIVESVRPFSGNETTWRVAVADVPLPDQSRGLVIVADDITQVVRLDRLHQLNQMARIVAHEVKNPLTPIRLWVQELEDARRRENPELISLLKEACAEISVQVERLEATASSFTNLAALERWEPTPVDIVKLVEATLEGLVVLQRRGISVLRDFAPEGVCIVVGDRTWIQRALDNLVKNSIDALGEHQGEIRIRVAAENESVMLEVEDTAGGVVESQLSDLFKPQFSTTSSGSGLGLALVSQVAARCHGDVTAHNGDSGLVVRMVLPLASGRMTQ